MLTTADRTDFTPPRDRHWRGPLLLALAAHGLLVTALTWGISWNTDQPQVAVEAELWSSLPQMAAPRLVEPEPVQEAPPLAPSKPTPPPAPAKPEPAPVPARNDAQIALQKKQDEEKRHQEQLEQQRKIEAKKREDTQKREEEKKREQLKKEEAARKKREAEQARKEKAEKDKIEKAKAEKEKAEQQKNQEAARKADEARQQAQLEADRKKNLERMMGLAGATGSANAKGNAAQSSGPSASYAGKLVARVKPNIVFTDNATGNPRAEVEVYALPDGTITGRKLLKASGNKTWDDAVLRAIDRTATLPRDENGKVPATLILGFRPLD